MRIQIGQRFSRWTVIGDRVPGTRKFPCRCECGTERAVYGPSLTRCVSKSCGCLKAEQSAARGRAHRKHHFNVGDKVGRWTVLDPDGREVLCRCECGTERLVVGYTLANGLSRSCGCLRDEIAVGNQHSRKHGLSGHILYPVWYQIVQRCTRPESADWELYGGRGIRVQEPWLDVATFIANVEAEIGHCSNGMTLDRIDNDGNYQPGNIRWATRVEQANNRGRTRPRVRTDGPPARRRIKVTPEQAAQIVHLVAGGRSQQSVAAEFGIGQPHVSRIVRGL